MYHAPIVLDLLVIYDMTWQYDIFETNDSDNSLIMLYLAHFINLNACAIICLRTREPL